jgi:photosystem II stability/assembly factor-like uncharacterized protein
MKSPLLLTVAALLGSVLVPDSAVRAQGGMSAAPAPAATAPDLTGLAWRNLGPMRGGRSIAVAGSPSRPLEYYFGATGGGLWKTTDGGMHWAPVTDGQIGSSSVGAVAIAPSQPDTVYLGMGESQLRGNVMQGDGAYKSIDGGATWKRIGLERSQVIARLRVHPTKPDLVYAAVLGDTTQPNPERGVYRSRDGGASWEQVLFRDDRTGAVDLAMDANNPDVLYASLWQTYRIPWKLWSGGPGSGLFKSTDAGSTWTELSSRPGFPTGVLGKIGVTVSPADSNRLFAVVEAQAGGLFRSDDAGATWTLANNHRDLWQRAFYFNRVQADPKDRDTVYILNFMLAKSTDAGASYTILNTHHADHHDLWIAPEDPQRMIVADDGGGEVTFNGGATWSHQLYSTAQPYRVETTADFPYHVVACQQDNSSFAIPVRDGGAGLLPSFPLTGAAAGRVRNDSRGYYYYQVGGGESGWVAPHPAKPDIFFAGSTNVLTRFDRRTGEVRDVQPWPRIVMGEPASAMPERWNWSYPVIFSPLAPHDLYTGSQHVWRSRDEGATWEKISPDLTRADPSTLGDTGGAIILDQDGPEVYATVFALAPSRIERDTVWAGSDDGLIHVTRDGGRSWTNVTPKEIPAHTRISVIEASPHAPGRAFVAAKRNQLGDRQPYLFRTDDFGATWTRLDAGLPRHEFTHVVREDPVRAGLLYCGTEYGVWASWDGGASWSPLQLKLPVVHVPDLKVEKHDLVIATHGRGFYVLENLAPLRQHDPVQAAGRFHLFTPEGIYREEYPAQIDFLLAQETRGARLEILDPTGGVLRQLALPDVIPAGHHRTEWNLRGAGAAVFPGMILEAASPARGVRVPPGDYQARLTLDGVTQTVRFAVQPDPRRSTTAAEYAAQYALAVRVRDAASRANEAVIRIREVKRTLPPGSEVAARLTAIEGEIYQIKNQSPKDKIANAIKVNDRLAALMAMVDRGDGAPGAPQQAVAQELFAELEGHLARLDAVLKTL